MMRYGYAFQKQLRSEIESLPRELRDRVERAGSLHVDELIRMIGLPRDEVDDFYLPNRSHVWSSPTTRFRPDNDFVDAFNAIDSGKVAFVITNGDVGTWRVPGVGISLLAHKIASSAFKVNCKTYRPTTWIMCSPQSTPQLASIVNSISPPSEGCIFESFESYVMNIMGTMQRDENNRSRVTSDGDGSLLAALNDAGVLDDNPDVKYLYVSDCRDAGSSFDVHVLQQHIENGSQLSSFMQVESVVDVLNDDRYLAMTTRAADDLTFITDGYNASHEVKSMGCNHDLHRSLGTHIINVETLKAHEIPWQRKRCTRESNVLQWYERSLASLTLQVPQDKQTFIIDDRDDMKLMHFRSEKEIAKFEKRFKLNL